MMISSVGDNAAIFEILVMYSPSTAPVVEATFKSH